MQIVKARKVKNLKPIIQVKMYVYDNRLKFCLVTQGVSKLIITGMQFLKPSSIKAVRVVLMSTKNKIKMQSSLYCLCIITKVKIYHQPELWSVVGSSSDYVRSVAARHVKSSPAITNGYRYSWKPVRYQNKLLEPLHRLSISDFRQSLAVMAIDCNEIYQWKFLCYLHC